MKIESVETCNPDTFVDDGQNQECEAHVEEEGKKKRRESRMTFTPEQISVLEEHYNNNPLPKAVLREEIGNSLGITAKKVDVWFKNRRAKAKREGNQQVISQVKIYFSC